MFSECKIGREVIFLFQRRPSLTVSGVFFYFFIHLILGVYIYFFPLFLVYLIKNYKHIHSSSGFSPPYGARLYTFVSLLCGISASLCISVWSLTLTLSNPSIDLIICVCCSSPVCCFYKYDVMSVLVYSAYTGRETYLGGSGSRSRVAGWKGSQN